MLFAHNYGFTNKCAGRRKREGRTHGEIFETVDAGIQPNRLIALDGGKHHHVFAVLILRSAIRTNLFPQFSGSRRNHRPCMCWLLVCAIRNMQKNYAEKQKQTR